MNVLQFLQSAGAGEIAGKCGIALVLLLTLLQITPIKINPWSWIGKLIGSFFKRLAGRIGKGINGEVIDKLGAIGGRLDEMENRLGDLEKHNREQDRYNAEEKALDARRRILRFGDEIRSGVRHSKEHFDNVFEDIKYYKVYCAEHTDFANDRVHISIKIIEDTYEKCIRENDFL